MSSHQHRLLLGAHMSISGGMHTAIEDGASIGCTTIQIFTKSNRQWAAKVLSQQEIARFKETAARLNIKPLVAHATYLINIASADTQTLEKSSDALEMELERCQLLGIPYLVLHPGSYVTGSQQEGLDRISRQLNLILEKVPGETMILLETMAGQGTALCSTLEQIAAILQKTGHPERLGVCFDTCHAFVAGYDFTTPEAYDQFWKQFNTIIGIEKIKAMHINDSKKGLGARVDRHEHIGKGAIGLEAFRLLFNDPCFFDIPKILETPKATESPFTEDKMNIATLRSLISNETKKKLGME